jgi:uncharacterized protein
MEATVAQKLEALLKLQKIDSKIDELIKVRGDLPEEVRDLEDEIAGYETRINKYNSEIQKFEDDIANRKGAIKESEKLIKKYNDQQSKVRNNREYDAITKEVELQELEIQICEKKIKESQARIELVKVDIARTNEILSERKKDLTNKNEELSVIIDEGQEEETKLNKERDKALKNLEDRLYNSYQRLRKNAKNGLAVVTVKRDACGGCFNTVPPQRQAEIAQRKKLIICEHCGRILADVEQVVVVEKVK